MDPEFARSAARAIHAGDTATGKAMYDKLIDARNAAGNVPEVAATTSAIQDFTTTFGRRQISCPVDRGHNVQPINE